MTVLTGKPNYPQGIFFTEYERNPEKFTEYAGAKIIRASILPRGKGPIQLILNYLSFVIAASWKSLTALKSEKIDVIFVYEPSPITVGIPAIFVARIKNAPIVFWALDLWPETLAAIGIVRSHWVLKKIGKMVRFIYDRCHFVLGQSEGFLNNIAQYCSDKNKIRYFPSWAEDIFSIPATQIAPEAPKNDGRLTILFAGNVGDAQDFPSILTAASQLKSEKKVRWIIVGDGRNLEWLADEVKERGLENDVYLLGRFPVERMPEFYTLADALLVSLKKAPVFSMTIPGKIQSYLMSGIPILGMLDGEGARIIQAANAGFTCPAGDSSALVKCVQHLATLSPENRQELGSNGKRYAKAEFDRNTLIDRLEQWLQEAISSKNIRIKR